MEKSTMVTWEYTNTAPQRGSENYSIEYIDADVMYLDDNEFSDLGTSIDTGITSLASSMLRFGYEYENGRRYHSLNEGTYPLPNDETEQDRLDLVHHAVSLTVGGALHLVRLPSHLNRILDLGTGTGIWAIDMAEQHPEATVIGVDLSPIQPSWVPPNCSFEVDDIEKPWIWNEPFDFIRSAHLTQGIRDWPTYISRIFDNLTPGGSVQLCEFAMQFACDDGSVPNAGFISRYKTAYDTAAAIAGLDEPYAMLEEYLEASGFEEVKVVIKKMPVGTWPRDPKKKEIGQWGLAMIEPGLMSYGFALFTRYLGMTESEATVLCRGAFEEFQRRDVHAYVALWFVEGRKPMEGDPM